jgi:hypothetical protein
MNGAKRWISMVLLSFSTVSLAYSQTIFDVPSQCAVTLQKDIYSSIKSTDEDLAFASLVDQHTYDEIKHDASASATIPLTAGLVGASANYSDYQKQVTSLYSSLNIHYTKSEAEQMFTSTTSERAFNSFDTCMKTLAASTTGFTAWILSEDVHDVILACHFTAPGSGVKKMKLDIKVVEGGSIKGRASSSQTLSAGDECAPIAVDRNGFGPVKVSLGGDGWPSVVVVSDFEKPPANVATLIYSPLEKQDEDVELKQEDWFTANAAKQTPDLDNAGGCKRGWPPEFCSSTFRYAFPTVFNIDPPLDGDIYDPGQVNLATYRDVDGRHGGSFCEQYGVTYTRRPGPDSHWPAGVNPEYRQYVENLEGKHELWVGARCWGAPARITIHYKRYHMVPGKQEVRIRVPFQDDKDFTIEPPTDTPAQLSISYGNGQIANLKPGDSSADKKIQFKQKSTFNGTTYYVYHYSK